MAERSREVLPPVPDERAQRRLPREQHTGVHVGLPCYISETRPNQSVADDAGGGGDL